VKGKVVAIAETPVTVVGNVVSELPQRTTNGHEVVTFWMRSNERLRDKGCGTRKEASGSTAETCWSR
jgi:single-strand DNA-binding protein